MRIEKAGRKTLRVSVDASSRESIDRLRDAALQKFGRVDILLNSAGQNFRKPSHTVAEDEWNGIMDINVTGIFRACQSF